MTQTRTVRMVLVTSKPLASFRIRRVGTARRVLSKVSSDGLRLPLSLPGRVAALEVDAS